jgi:hypothetical protein
LLLRKIWNNSESEEMVNLHSGAHNYMDSVKVSDECSESFNETDVHFTQQFLSCKGKDLPTGE